MGNRKRKTIDFSTGDRELLLERVKELTGEDEAAAAIEEALRSTIDFYELIKQHREEVVDGRLDLTHHRVNVRTSFERRRK